MKLNLILERSNLFEPHDENFDFSKDSITYKEVFYSREIEELSSKEIERFKSKVFETMKHSLPRNGFEYINDKSLKSINVLILDYSLTQDWKKDVEIQKLINFIESYFEVKIESNVEKTFDMNNIEHTIEIDSYGAYNLEHLDELQNLFEEYKIEYKVIYEKTSEINIGASGSDLKAIFQLIGTAADILTVIDFLGKKFPYDSGTIQDYNIVKIKKQISDYYTIHESQLELVSIDYDEKRETIYSFTSRNHLYYMIYDKGKLKNTYRKVIIR